MLCLVWHVNKCKFYQCFTSQSGLAKTVASIPPFTAVLPLAADYISYVIEYMLQHFQPLLCIQQCVPPRCKFLSCTVLYAVDVESSKESSQGCITCVTGANLK
jgi:hypothetical protein